jgi:hypothetical protein
MGSRWDRKNSGAFTTKTIFFEAAIKASNPPHPKAEQQNHLWVRHKQPANLFPQMR